MGEGEAVYTLLGADGRLYRSAVPGLLGGHRRLKVYGRLDCPSALRAVANCRSGQKGGYVRHRVFFASEAVAIGAGYRPCGACLPEKYRAWRESQGVAPRGAGQEPAVEEGQS
ncbi:metal-binding protein [Kineosporia succinea]|uniref:Metal binding Ada-like protein n=1 Tax=Kineosporia succinea TaxID=84632 RepID=A0ABT9NWJ0_9ACTN|nr:metal-binding protein [Kineosporia succinea]MDP9824370.1 hypothetical protein [Kineosporia succinea]